MKVKVIDYGFKTLPRRAHYNDAGADVYTTEFAELPPHTTVKVPLGIGLVLPDGVMACIYPRSGLSTEGIVCELPPIDSGYRGEIHAIVSNLTDTPVGLPSGTRIGQLVITPVIVADFVTETGAERGIGGFGSTGKQ